MTLADETAWLDATALADLVRRKATTSVELVDAAIARCERLNPALNAVITPLFDQARAAATQEPDPAAPFPGVPFLLKDLTAELAGTPLSAGCAFLAGHYVSKQDSELVARHKRAGLIVLGKANTSEFGLVPTCEPLHWGPTHNPWRAGTTPGGSSGGPAAAVAAGIVPMAHANDGGGSIRIPASCCGLFGLKPTRGRNSLGPNLGEAPGGLSAEHAVTRSVRDSAALLDATRGPAPGDPYFAPPPERPFVDEVGRDPGRLRIAFARRPLSSTPVHADCVAAVEDAARLCESLGHTVEEASPPVEGDVLLRRFAAMWRGMLGATIRGWERRLEREGSAADFEPWTWRMFEVARESLSADYLLAVRDVHATAREIARWFANYDLWLTPTLCQPPMPHGYFAYTPETGKQARARLADYTAFTLPFNITGQPAMSVPLHWNGDSLPIGVQFVARYGDEGMLFRLAAQLEAARPWAQRRPPMAA